jgi:hypothetical protein
VHLVGFHYTNGYSYLGNKKYGEFLDKLRRSCPRDRLLLQEADCSREEDSWEVLQV